MTVSPEFQQDMAVPTPEVPPRRRQHIEDYALIGDLETAALVSRTGSIEAPLASPRDSSNQTAR